MQVFDLHRNLIKDYSAYIRSFIQIRDERINQKVQEALDNGHLWPEPLIQLNPSFEPGGYIDDLVERGVLHPECSRIFRINKGPANEGLPMQLHKHQAVAIAAARNNENYVLTTGTGSGKSLAYIIPIVDYVLRHGSGKGIQAIIVYPMNALANSQYGELKKFLCDGYPGGNGPVTFDIYTGQEDDEKRRQIIAHPPDILITNYVMLELILTRVGDRDLIRSAQNLHFLVLDELHTYRGRQGADVAMLVHRLRDNCGGEHLRCVGTSATLAGEGTFEQQQEEVAKVASLLFGTPVKPQCVIGETLRRATPLRDEQDPQFITDLTRRIADTAYKPAENYDDFIQDPLAIWIESTFGLTTEPGTGRLKRSKPRSIGGDEGAASELSQLTGVPEERCIEAIQETLLAGYVCKKPNSRFPVFAFRLHAFISRGDTVYASLEPADKRYITLEGQQFVPNDREKILLPLAFCRECGQEYYMVKVAKDKKSGETVFTKRELTEVYNEDDREYEAGFLYYSEDNPWPTREEEVLRRLPDDWVEIYRGNERVRPNRQPKLPRPVHLDAGGRLADRESDGVTFQYIKAPFHFCLNCGVAYGVRQSSDFAKLSTLGSEGRSTATTILSMTAIRHLRREESLPPEARKLLSFTDNRQDASLQAGHFNDFVEIGLLRSALYRAVKEAGPDGLSYDQLTQQVFKAMNLPLELYASNPDARFQALKDTQQALRNVLGYRLYHDLRRGWRITSPNLEQCGLLEIKYNSLEELAAADDEDIWSGYQSGGELKGGHPALITASPAARYQICKVLLDYMRRELCIKVDYLNPEFQERIKQQSNQKLVEPWAIDDNERMVHAAILCPRPRTDKDYLVNVYLSERSGFAQYLRRRGTFPAYHEKITQEDTIAIIQQLLNALVKGGMLEIVDEPAPGQVPGYQLNAACMTWVAGDGTRAFHDPIRVPHAPEGGGRTNPFFVAYYRSLAEEFRGITAREHTAQVPNHLRQRREEEFRQGTLPVLYCSPTMELGVDISQLNMVNMRNIPPTPANYAQRSGRAGRSGQPALVFSYCSAGSPHDQYFFKHPDLMVAGAVTPPRLDLTNEELIKSHIHAIWLEEAGVSLGKSLKDILDVSGDNPSFELLPSVKEAIHNQSIRNRALLRAKKILADLNEQLGGSLNFNEERIKETLNQLPLTFERACDRWRGLYRAALQQCAVQNRIITDASRSAGDKETARRLRREAESQLELLTKSDNISQSDFYSYRYFASEGFLPGYSFPRLPISAYIPGRRRGSDRDEFLNRPRFLAIAEYGPRSIVYHEGSRYVINRVILPVGDRENNILTRSAKICPACGYLHELTDESGPDLCERCGETLGVPITHLFRMENVTTRRRDRINSDEEERLRWGYEIKTVVRFAERAGQPSYMNARLILGDNALATLTYGDTATLWRINLGWSRRRDKEQTGFVLDLERGYWAKNEMAVDDTEERLSQRTARVIPYVADSKNCLLFKPEIQLEENQMASLQAALKTAIQIRYQLEDNELAAEPLPDRDNRRVILFYEAAEGGAGVLRRLLEDPGAMAAVAVEALQLCHFDPATGEDLRRSPGMKEDCEAACYSCLLNYGNQRDHALLDRQSIRALLLDLARCTTETSPTTLSRAEHLAALKRQAGSGLEIKWLDFLKQHHLKLPNQAQILVEACRTRPDFLYEGDTYAAIYIDGPHHDYPERQGRDQEQTECMMDKGYEVIRFGYEDNWAGIIEQYSYIFGRLES